MPEPWAPISGLSTSIEWAGGGISVAKTWAESKRLRTGISRAAAMVGEIIWGGVEKKDRWGGGAIFCFL